MASMQAVISDIWVAFPGPSVPESSPGFVPAIRVHPSPVSSTERLVDAREERQVLILLDRKPHFSAVNFSAQLTDDTLLGAGSDGDQPPFDSILGQFRGGPHSHLLHHVRLVKNDCAHCDVQDPGDLLKGLSFRHKLQDFLFARR